MPPKASSNSECSIELKGKDRVEEGEEEGGEQSAGMAPEKEGMRKESQNEETWRERE